MAPITVRMILPFHDTIAALASAALAPRAVAMLAGVTASVVAGATLWARRAYQGLYGRRKEALDLAQANDDRFRDLADNAPDIIYRFRLLPTPRYEYVNRAVATVLGYSPDDFYEDPDIHSRIVHPDDLPLLAELVEHAPSCTLRVRWIRSDGDVVWTEPRVRPLYDRHGTVIGFDGVATDVTARVRAENERQALEEQLHRAQRLESMGRLASGVAHDFNNLLTVIAGLGAGLHDTLAGTRHAHDVDEILAATDRGAALVGQLLAFTTQQPTKPGVVDLNGLVRGAEKFLLYLVGRTNALHVTLADDLEPVVADVAHVEQMLMNLVANARDAMDGSGDVRVWTRSDVVDAQAARQLGVDAGRYVVLGVTDTGTGIDATVLPHIFVPFFTTKGDSGGTGLGLATVYGIAAQAGGTVHVTSDVDAGTTFAVYLPAAEVPAATGDKTLLTRGRGERILVAGDEEAARVWICRVLREHGFVVEEAGSVEQATAWIYDHGADIDLLLTDVVMPRASGHELADELMRMNTSARTVFMTGWATDLLASPAADGGPTVITKPSAADELIRQVREALEAPDAAAVSEAKQAA
jgi:PAS domain S-box-containing protein